VSGCALARAGVVVAEIPTTLYRENFIYRHGERIVNVTAAISGFLTSTP
jgi:hypothetical protein